MFRIVAFVVAAVALLLVLWWVVSGLMHLLVLGFWIALVALVGIGLFRVTHRSRRVRD